MIISATSRQTSQRKVKKTVTLLQRTAVNPVLKEGILLILSVHDEIKLKVSSHQKELVKTAITENCKSVDDDDNFDDLHYSTVSSKADGQQNTKAVCCESIVILTFNCQKTTNISQSL